MRVSNDFAYGSFGCNKTGVNESWSSKSKKEYTQYDHKLVRKRQAEIAAKIEAAQGKAAIKANELWGRLRVAVDHPYGARKGIKLHGVRQMHKSLVVPVYIDNYITSLQFINPEGEKRFLTDGKMIGAYYWLGEENDVIYITEGYATACSIYEATGKQVVITFNAGNILPVATMMRERMPNQKFIIAADNDQWTKGNPGLSKGQEAADKIGCSVIWPKFSYEDQSRPTDWNDYHQKFGITPLADELLGMKKVAQAAVVPDDKKWRTQLIPGKQELPGYKDFDPKAKKNVYMFLDNHELFKDMITYNIFTDRLTIVRCPPWDNPATFLPRNIKDTDYFGAEMELEEFGIKASAESCASAFRFIANENVINPPRDYFESLKWDGVKRLDKWLIYYLGCDEKKYEYHKIIGVKWMLGAVSRIYQPGCQFDNVLILEGPQGLRKTTVFRVLGTFHQENCFLEFSGDVNNKDSLLSMQGKVIVELSELATMDKSHAESLKSFITRTIDNYRPPYAKLDMARPRFFIFGATTNRTEEDPYLIDTTGGRRYWPAKCTSIDIDSLERDKEQLWAEAVARYKDSETTWATAEEEKLLTFEQENREVEDGWIDKVADYLIGKSETTTAKVCEDAIRLTGRDLHTGTMRKAAACLKKLGWVRDKRRPRDEDGDRTSTWRRKE